MLNMDCLSSQLGVVCDRLGYLFFLDTTSATSIPVIVSQTTNENTALWLQKKKTVAEIKKMCKAEVRHVQKLHRITQ